MNKVLILQGLPGSGKTTYAKHLCETDPSYVRINKDDIRASLKASEGLEWSHEVEKTRVVPVRDHFIHLNLGAGSNVIVDDTNFSTKHLLDITAIANTHQAEVEVKFFDVPVDECIRRDARRTGSAKVGEKVIQRMAHQYLAPPVVPYVEDPTLPWAIICDLDGTLALFTHHRGPYEQARCADDTLNRPVAAVLSMVLAMNSLALMVKEFAAAGYGEAFGRDLARIAAAPRLHIIFLSGRDEQYRPQTVAFLDRNQCNVGPLYMRPAGDQRKDTIIKSELFDQHIRGRFNVLFCLDDRDSVVANWRRIGLTVFQVAEGKF